MNNLLRLLVIEDNPGDMALLENMLQESALKFEMTCVERLSAGVELVKADHFDVILLDLGLPDSYGLDTLLKFKADELAAPVIVLTGLGDDNVGTLAVKAGAQDYLIKGQIDINLLSRSIIHAIERKNLFELIQSAAQDWAASFDAMADGVSIHAPDFTILKANKSLLELLGKRSDEVIGTHCYEVFHTRDCPVNLCPLNETKATGQRVYAELFEPNLDKWLAITTSPVISAAGSLERIVHTVRDISEQRKLELQLRQAQKMESIGTLAGGIAHDFNNILTAIIGYGNLALMKLTAGDPQRLYIEQILQASDRAAELTRDLLLFSRKQNAEKMPVNLSRVVTDSGRFLKRIVSEEISFLIELPDEPLIVLANEHQLEQILMNLVTNACDAMPKGGTLTLRLARFSMDHTFVSKNGFGQAGDYLLLTVADTGMGIDSKTQQHIFEPFFTTKEVGKGTGLGLAVVYGIIKQHDGYITVFSEQGNGSTFSIYLPLNGEETTDASQAEQEISASEGTETILLVEDDEQVRRLLYKVLSENGYAVIMAVDGVEAVNKFIDNKESIDLLLSDLIMPKMNGKEVYDKIMELKPEIKVIFLSGYAPDIIREKMLLTADDHLIAKPASPMHLLRKVRSVLDGEQ